MASPLIQTTIDRLRSFVTLPTQHAWRMYQEDRVTSKQFKPEFTSFQAQKCQAIQPNEKDYLVFEKGLKLAWFHQEIVIPKYLCSYDISGLNARLNLTWWAEIAAIFVNGKLVCEGDLFDSSTRLLLTDKAQPGETFAVAIALVSPGHDIGALMKSELLFEAPDLAQIEPSSFATELQILSHYLQDAPEKIALLEQELNNIPWNLVTETEQFQHSLTEIRAALIPLANLIKDRKFYVLGHAHLDMAWLWTTDETWVVGQRTFQSVINLQQEFPELVFGHSTPALYEWIEKNRPELWQNIKQAIERDAWEMLGGMWVEPDVNLVSGESIIRQFLYGQQYFLEKFGKRSTTAWLPDTFGFPNQLPQLAKHCAIEAFGTGKLHWNDTNPFPHGLFWWRSPDGSELLTLMTPPNVTGIMDTNPVTMTNYALKWEQQTGLRDIFWLPGVGDHGGGPTKDMLQVARKWQQSPFFPQLQFSTVETYLQQVKNTPNLPIWEDELYLELHRGCYTVHRDQKVFNSQCEILLRQVEIWSAIAQNLSRENQTKLDFQAQITHLWKKVLFNQFHDILPGTSIPEVFTEANQQWQAVLSAGEAILTQSLGAIAQQINYENPPADNAQPLLLFNDLNWERSETFSCPIAQPISVYDCTGAMVKTQMITEISTDNTDNDERPYFLSFQAVVPSVGYALYWLVPNPQAPIQKAADLENETEFILENAFLKVAIDPATGDIAQCFDKVQQKNIFAGPSNQFQAFADQGQYWDAWDIAPDYETNPLAPAQLVSIHWQEKNPVRAIIRVKKQLSQSTFTQDYHLEQDSQLLKIYTTADWQEDQVVLKVAFPFDLPDASCTYETPCGAIARQPEADPAKWEVPALRWANFHNADYGVSILTKNHHGYDAKAQQLRLTLLKSPRWPDPAADRGRHQLAYAIYPHQKSWQQAKTVQMARAFNAPLRAYFPTIAHQNQKLAPEHSFLNLGANNLILLALKRAETQSGYILRFYEAHGEQAALNFHTTLDWEITEAVNGLEDSFGPALNFQISPWKIYSYRLDQPSA
ncbi:alpha-mannosidase [[Synechococcus] sp. NIES-970]|nr:alpha-mannosidase [[Synechococcus] sp. NIES-970]